jgi:hypothetical protein
MSVGDFPDVPIRFSQAASCELTDSRAEMRIRRLDNFSLDALCPPPPVNIAKSPISSRPSEQPVEARVMSRRFTIVRIALGGLLLAAAGLKLYGLSVSAIPRVGWFSQPWVQIAAAEWEVILGLWLLSGSYPRGAWLAALATFAAFAAVSGYLGWIGVASCGCFGVIKASPWWAFGLDAAVIVLLFICRPLRLTAMPVGTRERVPEGVKWLGDGRLRLTGRGPCSAPG